MTPTTAATRLPLPALTGLFAAGFIGILTEALPAGLLPDMSRTLHESIAVTGQTVTVYAIGTAIAVVPLAVATTSWRRRDLLVVALLGQIVTNALTAVSGEYWLTLTARLAAGLSSGLIWSLLGAYAARLAPEGKQGRAIAIALGGIPVSLALGVPFGIFIAQIANWQAAFWCTVGLTLATVAWVLLTLPNLTGTPRTDRPGMLHVLRTPGILTILIVVACFVVAHNIMYTYIATILADDGLAHQTGPVLFTFGAFAVVSIFIVGTHIDRHLRKLILASTVLFAIAALVLALYADITWLAYAAAAAWGLAFGSSATLFTTAIVHAAGRNGDVAQSVMISIFSGSIALGGLIGGILLNAFNTPILVDTTLGLAAISAVITLFAKQHAFPTARPRP